MADTDLLVVSRGGVEYKITRGELDAYLKDGYTVVDSMLFNGTNAFLQRINATSGTGTTFTVSAWIKRGVLSKSSSWQTFFGSNTGTDAFTLLGFDANDALNWRIRTSSSADTTKMVTTKVFRDPSAWYHIVLQFDSTQAVALDRDKLWVNGVQITDFTTSNTTALNGAPTGGTLTKPQIGRTNINSTVKYYADQYTSEYNFIDGQALEPSAFGETGKFGEWLPKKYTGTYGTNGFYLEALDSADIGKDTSGNGNDFTNANVVQVTDTPTDNYAVFNPLIPPSGRTAISDGNLTVLGTSTVESGNDYGTIGIDNGKWYWETNVIRNSSASAYPVLGAVQYLQPNSNGGSTGSAVTKGFGIFSSGGVYKEGSLITTTTSFTAGDIIGIALNIDDLEVTFYKNGNPIYTLTSLIAGTYWSGVSSYANSEASINFGQKDFAYAPPTGYKTLSTKNLPDATVVPSKSFSAVTYTGDNVSGREITGVGFSPDFVWGKSRSQAYNHWLYDTVRGATLGLNSNTTTSELPTPVNGYVSSFDADGFTATSGSSDTNNLNQSGQTYAAWNWKAGTEVTNNDGTIESQVSANPEAGFSIVSFALEATGSKTVGHGLGVAPKMIIVKSRVNAASWVVYHEATGPTKFLTLQTTDIAATNSTVWDNTAPTSTLFTMGSGFTTAAYGTDQIAYCFADVEGYSKFGGYTGNGNANGPFVYTGFRPAFMLFKRTNAANDWYIYDSARDEYNLTTQQLYPNLPNAEAANANSLDLLSNGFKIRTTGAALNTSGGTYIYMAFAEQPFKNANAR